MKEISIFHIEDHQLFSQGIAAILSEDPFFDWKGSAIDGVTGIGKISELKPDIILVDYLLPNENGIDLAEEIHLVAPEAKLILLTMENSKILITKAKEAGFYGFISKTVEKGYLVESLRKIANGEKVFPKLKTKEREEDSDYFRISQLSKREKEIALLMVEGLSSNQMSNKLFLSVFTVNTHRRNISQKLGISNLAQLSTLIKKFE